MGGVSDKVLMILAGGKNSFDKADSLLKNNLNMWPMYNKVEIIMTKHYDNINVASLYLWSSRTKD